jgi:uncharacterized protein
MKYGRITTKNLEVKGRYLAAGGEYESIVMWKRLIIAFVALVLAGAIFIGGVTAQGTPDTTSEQLIHTSSIGEASSSPDRTVISIAVETENADPRVAQQQNAERMSSTIAALKNAGIAEDDLETSGYAINPVYENNQYGYGYGGKIRAYRVVNTLQITLRDVDRTGEILDIAVSSGTNRVNYISFTLSDEKQQQVRAQALTSAVRSARADADAVAAAAGLDIVRVQEITVGTNYFPMPVASYREAADGALSVPTPIVPGDVKVSVQVSVTYLCS